MREAVLLKLSCKRSPKIEFHVHICHVRAAVVFFPFRSTPHYPSLRPSKLITSRVAQMLTALVELRPGGFVDRGQKCPPAVGLPTFVFVKSGRTYFPAAPRCSLQVGAAPFPPGLRDSGQCRECRH